jgi:rod shape-determining protein MreC
MTLRDQNRALKAQVAELMQWQATANDLKAENEALQRLIHVVPDGKMRFFAARIVGDSGGPYMRSALISGGGEDGIKEGQAVISAEGLLGRVIEAGNSSSRVLLLTDINSRVPVVSEHSRERSIASGDNSAALKLDYVETGSRMEVGERLLTSGDGGIFPPGVPVGVITRIDGGAVTVQPLVDWARTEYVNVVDYEF